MYRKFKLLVHFPRWGRLGGGERKTADHPPLTPSHRRLCRNPFCRLYMILVESYNTTCSTTNLLKIVYDTTSQGRGIFSHQRPNLRQ
jgi:hypothetical protein